MTAAIALVVAAGAGCQRTSNRERDCAEVRAIVMAPDPANQPRRYWDYTAKGSDSVALFDTAPLERLQKLAYRDAEVREAALAWAKDEGWTFYSPYHLEGQARPARAKLVEICGLPETIVEAR